MYKTHITKYKLSLVLAATSCLFTCDLGIAGFADVDYHSDASSAGSTSGVSTGDEAEAEIRISERIARRKARAQEKMLEVARQRAAGMLEEGQGQDESSSSSSSSSDATTSDDEMNMDALSFSKTPAKPKRGKKKGKYSPTGGTPTMETGRSGDDLDFMIQATQAVVPPPMSSPDASSVNSPKTGSVSPQNENKPVNGQKKITKDPSQNKADQGADLERVGLGANDTAASEDPAADKTVVRKGSPNYSTKLLTQEQRKAYQAVQTQPHPALPVKRKKRWWLCCG